MSEEAHIEELNELRERVGVLEFLLRGEKHNHLKDNEYLVSKVHAYEAVLDLIAAEKRPDGTYNRGREACEQLAKEVLAEWRNTI